MNASFFEKVGEDFIELDACTSVSLNRGFAEEIPIGVECTTASSRHNVQEPSAAISSSQSTSTPIMTLRDVHDHALLLSNEDYTEKLQIDVFSENVIQDTNVTQPTNSTTTSSRDNIRAPKVVILSNEPYYGDLVNQKKRQNKASKDPNKYPRNLNKELRMKGEGYLGYRRDRKAKKTEKFKVKHDVFKPARSMKPACTSSFCKKSKLRACDIINEEQRQHLFTTFWKTMNWEQRRSFICSHVMVVEKKITKNPESKRTESRSYIFTIENKRYQVCKKMFLDTLGIKDWFVRYWLKKTDCAMPPDRATSSVNRNVPTKTGGHEHVEKFLAGLPKMPSHYCRASTSREYLEPVFQNMTDLYNKYKEDCEFASKECVGRRLFDEIFMKLNLSLFHPKKDQCDVCCSHKTGNLTDEKYAKHIMKKNQARNEKETDKLDAQSGACHVFTQDVQAVKLAPYLQASAIYYKTKLCVHNFTLYNLATKEVMCYWFDESNCTLEASAFASCIIDHLEMVMNQKLLPIILYSDGCCAQNRNATLSNALLRLSIEKNIVITQKYLEKGHTHMECDSVHSAIECKLKRKEIYLPKQYVSITKTARKDPMPYEARLLDHTFFTDFSKDLVYKSIRPGKKSGDPVVTDLRVLQYRPNGTIWYKNDFDHELQPLPQRPTPLYRIKPINQLAKLNKAKIPISRRKYQDLQDLKSVIPQTCHTFYDELPYSG